MTSARNLITTLIIALLVLVPIIGLSVSVAAQNPDINSQLCEGASDLQWTGGGGDCSTDDATTTVNDTVRLVINIFSWIVGVVSVIMIIWGGFKYITSGGDSNNVTAAKNTILYAIIGLVIVALAQVIVRFVLGTAGQV